MSLGTTPHGGGDRIRVVAFGGGHGLSASLRALRATGLPLDITAVVTVADDGGSSGRIRAGRDVLPPGDLRQALAALAGPDEVSDRSARLLQYRFGGADELAGHPVGNVVLCGLMEQLGDPVAALDHVAAMLRAVGRVLPMSCRPLSIEADIEVGGRLVTVRGQHQVAVAHGRVVQVRLVPPEPDACPQALTAIAEADWLVFGPGSWYTSVIPHLLVPQLAHAITASGARRLVTLNLAADRETMGLSLPDHLDALGRYLPDLKVDIVLVDRNAVPDPEPVANAAESLGARIAIAPVAVADGTARHDPVRLGRALVPLLGTAR
ncbi:gluconeogenesis factor YvcK family protein [Catellatospora bangladeshensis]|uniref:Putative gluconeogenesis factor n=1 Tax=Catellatospora bangladeshensis TaxID=310355 RepID=A0A8J3J8A1_9ACTN|nr:uridine diphosphate-N-acetylglucosamine-binding protein YvcK [Catellatospora bangladeshensis]GIF79176.1 putative gluconeogenesis factor [Catellatospora bangladeshensis]